ncbi:MAG: hypothetical protein LKK08_06945 [Bacteroidales bacterium]|jgi:hypothetical protein|nr:hypothetical protein [Bacteroidales bacterium]MCI2145964.1 hypothetical protein [Bacteroidales bacterium]
MKWKEVVSEERPKMVEVVKDLGFEPGEGYYKRFFVREEEGRFITRISLGERHGPKMDYRMSPFLEFEDMEPNRLFKKINGRKLSFNPLVFTLLFDIIPYPFGEYWGSDYEKRYITSADDLGRCLTTFWLPMVERWKNPILFADTYAQKGIVSELYTQLIYLMAGNVGRAKEYFDYQIERYRHRTTPPNEGLWDLFYSYEKYYGNFNDYISKCSQNSVK